MRSAFLIVDRRCAITNVVRPRQAYVINKQQLSSCQMYTVSEKNIPNIFDCNLKTNYQILIISGTIFLTKLAIKWPFSFPPQLAFVSALPGENTTSEISLFYLMQYDCLINIMRKKTHFVHISNTLADISSNCLFLAACSKIAWSICPLKKHRKHKTKKHRKNTEHRQGKRRFLHSLTAVSMKFCSRPMQAVPVASWLFKHS